MKKPQLMSLVLVLCICSVKCMPSLPLNHRSRQMALQGWLFLEDHIKQKSPANDPFQKRISQKSVFVVPSFGSELMPDCADGYASDSMGRCIKVITLNEEAHVEFLLRRMNENYGQSVQKDLTKGPFQVTVPLDIPSEDKPVQVEQTNFIPAILASSFVDDVEDVLKKNGRNNVVQGKKEEMTSDDAFDNEFDDDDEDVELFDYPEKFSLEKLLLEDLNTEQKLTEGTANEETVAEEVANEGTSTEKTVAEEVVTEEVVTVEVSTEVAEISTDVAFETSTVASSESSPSGSVGSAKFGEHKILHLQSTLDDQEFREIQPEVTTSTETRSANLAGSTSSKKELRNAHLSSEIRTSIRNNIKTKQSPMFIWPSRWMSALSARIQEPIVVQMSSGVGKRS